MKANINVDIVIPTYHPDERFTALIEKLQKQDYPIRHIHIVDTKTKYFPQSLEQIEGISVSRIASEDFDHGGTRRSAFAMSDAEIMVFMTQDAVPANDSLIRKLVTPLLNSEQIGASYARQLPAKDCDVLERYTRRFNYPEKSRVKRKEDIPALGIKTFFCSNVCAAYRRDIYERVGGFPERAIFNEDMILAGKMVKAGYQIAYAADAKVIHSHNYSGRQQFHRNFDLAVSQADCPEVFAEIRSESEGIRLVKQTIIYLWKKRKVYLIPVLIYKSGCKYAGYKLGKNYKKLPMWLVKKCSMSSTYWENR